MNPKKFIRSEVIGGIDTKLYGFDTFEEAIYISDNFDPGADDIKVHQWKQLDPNTWGWVEVWSHPNENEDED